MAVAAWVTVFVALVFGFSAGWGLSQIRCRLNTKRNSEEIQTQLNLIQVSRAKLQHEKAYYEGMWRDIEAANGRG